MKVSLGQWWETSRKTRFCVVGRATDGMWILEFKSGVVTRDNGNWEGCRQLHGCDSFEWIEYLSWPKFYINSGWKLDAYIRRDMLKSFTTIGVDGEVRCEAPWTRNEDSLVGATSWQQVSRGEALARVKTTVDPEPDQPAEVWPKYYVCDTWTHHAYIVRSQCEALDLVKKDGTVEPGNRKWDVCDANNVSRGAYKEVTKQEAQQRLETFCKPAEVWPKWYVTILESDSYYQCDSENEVWSICSGHGERQSIPASRLKNTAVWIEVTEAEALARVTPPEPVESPDDWVTQDRVPARIGKDQLNWNGCMHWNDVHQNHIEDYRIELRHGWVDPDDDAVAHVRCRRKDLPVPMTLQSVAEVCTTEPGPSPSQPAVKRVPVRLYWYDGNIVGRYEHSQPTDESFSEILHDAGGFYVEVPE